MYIDVLSVLALRGPLKLTHIMYKSNVNCCILKEYLGSLLKQGLVEEKTLGKHRVAYVITEKGLIVLKQFKELKQVLPIIEEEQITVHPLF
jgi:predicted transcriptional regulator